MYVFCLKYIRVFFPVDLKNKAKVWLVKINKNLMQALTFKNKATTWLVKSSDLKTNKAKVWR